MTLVMQLVAIALRSLSASPHLPPCDELTSERELFTCWNIFSVRFIDTSKKMASSEKVTRMEDILNTPAPVQNKDTPELSSKAEKHERPHVPRGKPKSGRIWKGEKTKFSSIIKTRGIRLSFDKKQKLREDLKRVKEMSRAIKAQKQADKEAKKQRRRENLKRAEENRKKSEIVQVIKNTAKIKRMKKKQLRMIQKRDTTNM